MWSLALAVLANVGGLLTATFALLLFSRSMGTGQAKPGTRHGLALLSLLGAGSLLATTGQYKLIRTLYYQIAKAEAPGRLALMLQEPVESMVLQVSGSDPFADRAAQCTLRLRVSTKAGATFVSEIPQSEINVPEVGKVSKSYRITRQSLLRGVRSDEKTNVASGLLFLKDWRQVQRVEAELLLPKAGDIPLPRSLTMLLLEEEGLGFEGKEIAESPAQQDNHRVAIYRDPIPLAEKFADWETTYMPAHDDQLGLVLGGGLLVGALFLLVGVSLLAGGYPTPTQDSVIPISHDLTSTPAASIPSGHLPRTLETQAGASPSGPLAALELKRATSLRINYSVQNKTKSLLVDDPGQVRATLASLVITGEDKKIGTQYFPLGTIDFLVPDREEIKTKFVSATHLEKDNWGQLYVTEDFYSKVCELLSKAEGRPMDILANNR